MVHGRDPVVLLGMVAHVATFYLVGLILPRNAPFGNTPDESFWDPR